MSIPKLLLLQKVKNTNNHLTRYLWFSRYIIREIHLHWSHPFLALLARGQMSLCDGTSSVVRPSVVRPSSVNFHPVYALTCANIVGSSPNFEISFILRMSRMSSNMGCQGQRSRSQWPEMWFSCLHSNMCKYCLMTTKISNKCCTKYILVRFEYEMSRSKVKVTLQTKYMFFITVYFPIWLTQSCNRVDVVVVPDQGPW